MRTSRIEFRRQAGSGCTLPRPIFARAGITLLPGDCLNVLPGLADGAADAVITDPPYCSGGMTPAERRRDPVDKYCQNGKSLGRPSFAGDVRDQRSYLAWGTLWASECRRIVRPGGHCLIFSDWRQLPCMTDILQGAGWTWRGIVVWDKGRGARAPHKGYWRHQCEYIAWGTNGHCPRDADGPWDGCIRASVRQGDKFHITGKPTAVLAHLVQCVRPGGLIVDCFAGSSTTGVAALRAGRRAVLIESSPEYCALSRRRLAAELAGTRAA